MKHYHVISHTHWDREWYKPFESFRIQLIDLVERLMLILDQQDAYRFHLDAQTIILDDYLAVKPQMTSRLGTYISDGRILVGPWYVQNDFFLTSGEATVRNLLIGTEIAEGFGACMRIGYMPDQFGLISQIPQILRGFDIDTALFGRGYSFQEQKKAEFLWSSRDGSTLTAVHMPYWYNNAQRFPKESSQAALMLNRIDKQLSTSCNTAQYLLMNGVDHLDAQEDLLQIINGLDLSLDGKAHISQSTLPEYMEALKRALVEGRTRLDKHSGELRYGEPQQILAGTLSSRTYLKKQNYRCQMLVERYIEPLHAIGKLMGLPQYPKDELRYIWKLLLSNHAHDSICGCSVDTVHEHMVDRFNRVEEAGGALISRQLNLICDHIDRRGLSQNNYLVTVFNLSMEMRTEVVEGVVDVPVDEEVTGVTIVEPSGEEIACVVKSRGRRTRSVLSPINLPGIIEVDSFSVIFAARNVPALGFKTFIAQPHAKPALDMDASEKDGDVIENTYLRIEVHNDGRIDLVSKEESRRYSGLLEIEDVADIGDAYVFATNPGAERVTSRDVGTTIQRTIDNPFVKQIEITYTLHIPKCYEASGRVRSSSSVKMPIRIQISLSHLSTWADVNIRIDNRANDHRMRILFPTGIAGNFSWASEPFDLIRRDRTVLSSSVTAVPEQPTNRFVALSDETGGFAVVAHGLYEYEHTDSEGSIAITLLRANKFISNALSSIPMEERWIVPGNQCIGVHDFELSLFPFAGSIDDREVMITIERCTTKMIAHTVPVDRRKYGAGRPFVQDTDIETVFYREREYPELLLDLEQGTIRCEGGGLFFSSLKRAERRDSLILRVYNPSTERRAARLIFATVPAEIYSVDLSEKRLCKMSFEDSVVVLDVGAAEIRTVEIIRGEVDTRRAYSPHVAAQKSP